MSMANPAMDEGELQAVLMDLCERGLLTCTRGRPGEAKAQYALAWEPLDRPERYSPEVKQRHQSNMKAWGQL